MRRKRMKQTIEITTGTEKWSYEFVCTNLLWLLLLWLWLLLRWWLAIHFIGSIFLVLVVYWWHRLIIIFVCFLLIIHCVYNLIRRQISGSSIFDRFFLLLILFAPSPFLFNNIYNPINFFGRFFFSCIQNTTQLRFLNEFQSMKNTLWCSFTGFYLII